MAKQPTASEKVADQFDKVGYYRDTDRGILGGVIAGLSTFTGWDLTLLRVLFVLIVIFTALMPFAIAYIIVWICAPDQDSAQPKKPQAKTKSGAAKAAKAQEAETVTPKPNDKSKSTANLLLRIILMTFGIIGFITFIPLLIALIPITILSIIAIASATIAEAPFFVTTAILVGVFLFTIVGIGLHVSTALVTARLGRTSAISLISGIVTAIILITAATTTGALWIHRAGRDGIDSTWNSISDNTIVHLDGASDRHIRVDIGPIHFRTN